MMEFIKNPNIDFMGKRKFFYVLSGVLAAVTVASLVIHRGPNWSIDFTGGTLVQGTFQSRTAPVNTDMKTPAGATDPAADAVVPMEDVRRALTAAGLPNADLQSVPARNEFVIRFKSMGGAKDELATQAKDALDKAFPSFEFRTERVDFVGPVVGRHLIKQSFLASIFSMLGICIYVAFRFRNFMWGAAGVLALVHDVFITVGFMSVFNREVSVTVVAALLTLAGFSINDTIVIFDRMRESLRMRRKESFDQVINRSLNETLTRTIITSLTVFLVLLSILFFGGEVIREFALALTFGVLVGSYSSLFVAAPLIYDWQAARERARK